MSVTLRDRVNALGLLGLLDEWKELGGQPWVPILVDAEERVRNQRSLERRVRDAKLGRFKQVSDFDWKWPAKIDRALVEDLLQLEFIGAKRNIIIAGPNGTGKTMLSKNLAYLAILGGHTVRFVTASAMLNDLSNQESSRSLQAAIRRYCQPTVLVIDEVGYLSYNSRSADLLFEVVTGRYEKKPIILTTNKPFAEWGDMFPNATSVVTLVDRLVHHSEIIGIEGQSWRLKEARETSEEASARRRRGRSA